MSVYSYSQSKVIDEVNFNKPVNGGMRAYLHARNETDLATIKQVLDTLKCAGYDCVPFTHHQQPTLEVRGFKNEKELLAVLFKNEWIAGKPVIRQEESDDISWKDWLSKRTLQATGITYLIGDYGFMKYGFKEADKMVMAGAFSYFLGTLSLIFYGKNDQSDLQIQDLSKELEKFLAQEKIKIPEGSAMHTIAAEKQKDFLHTLNDFARRYPSEMFNTVTALAGIFVAAGAYKNKVLKSTVGMSAHAIREMKHEGWLDVGLGTLTTTSGIFATVVKEKKHDPDAPPKTGLAWLWEKVREHPLAIAGGGYSIATGMHALSTWKAHKEAKRVNDKARLASTPGRALFVGMALLSEFLLAISSKGHGEGVVSDESVDRSVIAIAAELIARQPIEQQDKLIEQMGTFLGNQEKLAMEDAKVMRMLRHQVQSLRDSPWTRAAGMQTVAVPAAAPAPEAESAPAAADKENPVWQAKIARETAAQQTQLART